MKTTVAHHDAPADRPNSTNVKLSVEIDEAEFERSIDAAFRKIANEVRIPGFRPGKVPRRVLEARLGTEHARQTALQDSIPEYYVKALVEENVDAISAPELTITGGAESGAVSFDAVVEVRPTVRVPGYDGLQVTIPSPTVSDDELDAQVERMRNAFAVLGAVERPARAGDIAVIDISATMNGEPVPGLTATAYSYEVGSGGVVPELDTALTGASAGDDLSFTADVPDSEDGDLLEFSVQVGEVQEKTLPEVTDEWAASASEFSSLAELRADMARRMSLVKRVQANMAMRDEVVKALVELVDGPVPETLVNADLDRRLQDLQRRLQEQGANIDMYLKAMGQSFEELIAPLRPDAELNVRADLALRAVAEAEQIDVSDDEVDAEITRLAAQFKMKPKVARRNLQNNYQMPVLIADLRKAKALDWLTKQASLVDPDGHAIERASLEVSPADYADAGGSAAPSLGFDGVDLDDDHDHDHDHDHHDHDHDHHDH